MNTKVCYLPYFEGVYHTQMIETFSNANAHMVCMVYTMTGYIHIISLYKLRFAISAISIKGNCPSLGSI